LLQPRARTGHHFFDITTLIQRTFSRTTRASQYRNVSILAFTGAKDDGGGGDHWSYKTCKQSNLHHQQTNTQRYTVRMPFPSPNQQCQSEVLHKSYIINDATVNFHTQHPVTAAAEQTPYSVQQG